MPSFGLRIYGTASEISRLVPPRHHALLRENLRGCIVHDAFAFYAVGSRVLEHNQGHYGTSCGLLHSLTSPIRRYPTLLVHRMIRDYGRSKEV